MAVTLQQRDTGMLLDKTGMSCWYSKARLRVASSNQSTTPNNVYVCMSVKIACHSGTCNVWRAALIGLQICQMRSQREPNRARTKEVLMGLSGQRENTSAGGMMRLDMQECRKPKEYSDWLVVWNIFYFSI